MPFSEKTAKLSLLSLTAKAHTTLSSSPRLIPFTPEVALEVVPTSLELNLILYPFLVKRMISSSFIKLTETSSSFSFMVIAAMPFFFDVLTYSSSAVFFTRPFLVANNTYCASVSLYIE